MNLKSTCIFLFLFYIGCSQQYSSVVYEKDNVDSCNEIYKIGNVFVYDYEIILGGQKFKLKSNNGNFDRSEFDLVSAETDSLGVDLIHLIVPPVSEAERTNDNQTEISYLQEPQFASFSSTGVVENENNVWIHPIRKGFFNSLETAPFPFVKKSIDIGSVWTDQMKIGENWGNQLWGEWKGKLLLSYSYEIIGRKTIQTSMGEVDCHVVSSSAESRIGTTKLVSFFSEKYGFVRLEYELLNDLEVNMWLVDFQSGILFHDPMTILKRKEYKRQ